jgi:hypothetical protein
MFRFDAHPVQCPVEKSTLYVCLNVFRSWSLEHFNHVPYWVRLFFKICLYDKYPVLRVLPVRYQDTVVIASEMGKIRVGDKDIAMFVVSSEYYMISPVTFDSGVHCSVDTSFDEVRVMNLGIKEIRAIFPVVTSEYIFTDRGQDAYAYMILTYHDEMSRDDVRDGAYCMRHCYYDDDDFCDVYEVFYLKAVYNLGRGGDVVLVKRIHIEVYDPETYEIAEEDNITVDEVIDSIVRSYRFQKLEGMSRFNDRDWSCLGSGSTRLVAIPKRTLSRFFEGAV